MQEFSLLVQALSDSTKTNEKLALLESYYKKAPQEDLTWVVALFTGKKPKRVISSTLLRSWMIEVSGLPQWLIEESYHTVGDLAETIALLVESYLPQQHQEVPSLFKMIEQLSSLTNQSEENKKEAIFYWWNTLRGSALFVFNKLLTGGFRIGVSKQLVLQALANTYQMDLSLVTHRLSGQWDPTKTTIEKILLEQSENKEDASKPYPFYLAYALETPPIELGHPTEWIAEWKWDGIRGQLIRRKNQTFIWSRGEELLTENFPELLPLIAELPDGTAIDGEIIGLQEEKILPFSTLQTRISRKTISKKQLLEAPVGFIAYDLLEINREDIRKLPLDHRKQHLKNLIAAWKENTSSPLFPILFSEDIQQETWEALEEIREKSRAYSAEGLMLKRKDSLYQTGRKRGDWWKWKIDPYTVDAVLIYAQKGHGRRSNLYTDYTFGVADEGKIVSFAKAYSGLTDQEIAQVDKWVKQHALEKFGPVRTVPPVLVFEIAFEGIAASNRHKSGVALRFPRIKRWRHDKTVEQIDTLQTLKKLLPPSE